jgi:3-hydroxyisobutyrate dehydrogenase-like beta-hydroxyacid dehydrogenase
MDKTAFLGLGVMGAPMAGHLAAKGYDVAVYNRTGEKARRWAEKYSGRVASSPAEAATGAGLIFMCLGDDDDVAGMVDALDEVLMKGALLIDHTTASPTLARRLYSTLGGKGVGFVDAPVSGGQAGAEKGALSVMCGGDAGDVERALPAMQAYAARVVHIGDAGAGQLCKAVNQICVAGLLQGLSEGVHFAQRAGLDIDKVLAAISGGAAQSWQMNNRTKTMAENEFEFGFAVDWMRKDLRIALSEARENGARLPVTALIDQFYADLQARGGGRWDTSSLIRRLNDV